MRRKLLKRENAQNYLKKGTRGNEDINFYIGKTNLYITKDFAGKIVMIMVYCRPSIYNLQRR